MDTHGIPCISIVTPSYNQSEYIEKTIRSVRDQDYPRVEHIVIDGGSTDNSVEVLKAYDEDITYWESTPDRGQSHAINKGLKRATGDILAYLNSDDFYLPGTFEAVADLRRQSPKAGLLHGRCRYVNEQGDKVGSQYGRFDTVAELLDLWDVWWNERQVVQPEVFWTREVYEAIGGFREDLNYVMDYDYWLRTLLAGFDVTRVDQEFTAFRFQPNQKSEESEAVADELRTLVKPYIWDQEVPVSQEVRERLQDMWLFDTHVLGTVRGSLERRESKIARWFRLFRSLTQHPRILKSASFWNRVRTVLGS